MSWSDPVRVAAVCLLAGCGFTPVYAPGGAAQALRNSITVEAGETVLDYRLRVAIEERLGRGADHVLTVTTRTEELQAAVTPEGTIMRFNLVGVADWVLHDAAGAEVARGEERAFTGYLTTGSTVATDTAARDAMERLAVILADRIIIRLEMGAGGG